MKRLLLPSPRLAGTIRPRRWALAAAAFAASAGAGALWATAQAETSARQLAQTRSALAALRAELAEAEALAAALPDALARWRRLEQAGAFGPHSSSRWPAALRQTLQRDIRAQVTSAHFSPPRSLGGEDEHPVVLASTLALELKLVHEGHLPALLATIDTNAGALVRKRRCRIERLRERHPDARSAALSAHCELDWITVDAGLGGSTR